MKSFELTATLASFPGVSLVDKGRCAGSREITVSRLVSTTGGLIGQRDCGLANLHFVKRRSLLLYPCSS